MGGSSAGSGASGQASALEARAVRELENLEIPEIEKQKLMLEMPKLVGLLQNETLDPSAFDALEIPQELRDNIMGAIESEKEYADQGITEEDRARLENIQRMTQADEQARQDSIMQSMAERGAGGAGSELAQRLMSNQASADRAQQSSRELAAQASQNRRQAAQNVANMSGQQADRDVALGSQKASAADEIARFNAMNRQSVNQHNLANQQTIANQGTDLRNQQQQYNKGLYQQDFQNRMAKASGIAGNIGNQAASLRNQAAQQAQAAQQKAAGITSLIGTGLSAAATIYGGPAAGAATHAAYSGATAKEGGVFEEGGMKMSTAEDGSTPAGQEYSVKELNQVLDQLKEMTQGSEFAEGGNPTSYTEGGERIDELVDAGEMSVNTDAQNELMEMLRGNLEPEEMSDSRIVEGDSFSGDLLPDRINSGEMVVSLGQQDKMKEEIQDSGDEARGFKKLLGLLGKK